MYHRHQPKSELTKTLDLFNGNNVEQTNRYLKGYGITIESEGDKFVAISSFGTVYRTYNADGSVESDINTPSRAEIAAAEVTVTNAQEDYGDREAYVPLDPKTTPRLRVPCDSQFAGTVREGDADSAACILDGSFRQLLLNPRSNFINILRFYASGGELKRSNEWMRPSGEDLFCQQNTPELEKAQASAATVKAESDERTVNNVMRHGYRVLSEEEKADMLAIKDMGLAFWNLIDGLGNCRENSVAKTKIEEAVMWATKGLTK